MNTRWASPIMDNAWLMLKFTRKYDVDKVIINWENAYAKDYDIQTSLDGRRWTTVAKVRNSDGGEDEVSFNPTTAQYVRLKCINRATGYGISIWEMQVLAH